jgi:outer membrane protein assembly factor BamB
VARPASTSPEKLEVANATLVEGQWLQGMSSDGNGGVVAVFIDPGTGHRVLRWFDSSVSPTAVADLPIRERDLFGPYVARERGTIYFGSQRAGVVYRYDPNSGEVRVFTPCAQCEAVGPPAIASDGTFLLSVFDPERWPAWTALFEEDGEELWRIDGSVVQAGMDSSGAITLLTEGAVSRNGQTLGMPLWGLEVLRLNRSAQILWESSLAGDFSTGGSGQLHVGAGGDVLVSGDFHGRIEWEGEVLTNEAFNDHGPVWSPFAVSIGSDGCPLWANEDTGGEGALSSGGAALFATYSECGGTLLSRIGSNGMSTNSLTIDPTPCGKGAVDPVHVVPASNGTMFVGTSLEGNVTLKNGQHFSAGYPSTLLLRISVQ